MAIKTSLPISSCWIVTEGLIGLQNQAIGLAQELGVSYVLKDVKKPKGLWSLLGRGGHGINPPWPDLLISCGRQAGPVSVAVRRASKNKTYTVHIQDPFIDPKKFDLVIAPAHDKLSGENIFVTQGAIHQVTREKLDLATGHFRGLLATLPRPVISVLVGGKNKHQGFSGDRPHDFARKLSQVATNTGGGLAISFSRRTGARNEEIIRQGLAGVPAYIWDGKGENPYFGLLSLAEVIIVTSDSISMISEACSTGKPVYIYELPNAGARHQQFCAGMVKSSGHARLFSGTVETWKNTPLDETRKAANFVYERFCEKDGITKYADISSRASS